MVVYENSLVTIAFFPETDVLQVNWANIAPYAMLEVAESLKKLVSIVQQYHAKNILIDASQAQVSADYGDYFLIVKGLMEELGKSNVQKVARIKTSYPEREAIMESVLRENFYAMDIRHFRNTSDAMAWLSEPEKT